MCFIGIVPVKAAGPISEKDALYISENNPLRAMTEKCILAGGHDGQKFFVGFATNNCDKEVMEFSFIYSYIYQRK